MYPLKGCWLPDVWLSKDLTVWTRTSSAWLEAQAETQAVLKASFSFAALQTIVVPPRKCDIYDIE